MPISKSAKKFMRSSEKRRVRNLLVKKKMKTLTKNTLDQIKEGNLKEATKYAGEAVKAIDKASQKKVIKKNKASRKKRQLFRNLKNLKEKS
jgi:small subunit ribosomal protein S20